MVRGVTALCGASDALVALSDESGRLAPARVFVGSAGSDGQSVPDRHSLTRVAASGRYLSGPDPCEGSQGLWNRVRQNGSAEVEADGESANIAAPLRVDGVLVGMLGVSLPPRRLVNRDGPAEVSVVAALGSAALGRLNGLSS